LPSCRASTPSRGQPFASQLLDSPIVSRHRSEMLGEVQRHAV
jgi:hypothetical protein